MQYRKSCLSCRWLGTTTHLLFLFFVVVVLQSLLIAQMNHTYSNIQQDADILLILDRARSIIFIQKATAGLPGIVMHNTMLECDVKFECSLSIMPYPIQSAQSYSPANLDSHAMYTCHRACCIHIIIVLTIMQYSL